MKLSVVIPVFNESKTIRQVVENLSILEIPRWQKEIIIVDDGSSDDSRSILREYENLHKIIYHSNNLGKGSAVQTGLKQASGDYILIHDADLEYNPLEIPSLITELENRQSDKIVIYGSPQLPPIQKKRKYNPPARVSFFTP